MTITNVPTNHVIAVSTNSSGAFDSGALIPGNYTTQFSAPGFGAALGAKVRAVGQHHDRPLQLGAEKNDG